MRQEAFSDRKKNRTHNMKLLLYLGCDFADVFARRELLIRPSLNVDGKSDGKAPLSLL